jgi:hypothetical protein
MQIYETTFRIQHAILGKTDRWKNQVSDGAVRQAVVIAEVAFNMYFNDVKSIVKKGVEGDIERFAMEDEVMNVARGIGKHRRERLKEWITKGTDMLNYDSYVTLLRALASTPEEVVAGLPRMGETEITTMVFAESLYKMVQDPARNPVKAPILAKGAFLPALKVAIQHIGKLSTVEHKVKFVVHVLQLTTELLKIKFIPWSARHEGAGRPPRVPVWNSWASLGAKDEEKGGLSMTLRPEEAMHKAATDAQKAAMRRDAYAPWSAGDVKLRDLDSSLERRNLPDDWVIPQQSSGYVLETYEYVRDTYDEKNDVHRLALLVGIVMSRCLPDIFPPGTTATRLKGAKSRAETRQIAKNLPWTSKTKTKGTKESAVFMAMFVTFIIAIYDGSSPLRRYMQEHEESMGGLWTDKHSR